MRRLWRTLTSMRTTAVTLVAVSLLLLLNVVLPQRPTTDAAQWAAMTASGAGRFFWSTLGLGNIPASPLFHAGLVLFFVNLGCVLVDRGRATLKRLVVRPPTASQLRTMAERPHAVSFERPPAWDPTRARTVLARLGFRTHQPDADSVWGIKNPLSSVGSPLFHLSFFVLCAAGALIYFTRHEVIGYAGEGQLLDEASARVVRARPVGEAPSLSLRLVRVEPVIEDGVPLQLGATLEPEGGAPAESWVNQPAQWDDLSVYIEGAGLTPVLWLQDARGFTVERVALLARPGKDDALPMLPLEGGRIEVRVVPVRMGPAFPSRAQLARAAIALTITRDGKEVFLGELRPGDAVPLGDRVLVLEELRYWARLRLVWERGGGLLIAGFVLAMVGLTWRLVWRRRELGVVWDEHRITLVGRTEFFPVHFKQELTTIRDLLAQRDTSTPTP